MPPPPSEIYEFGDFRLDVTERQLLRSDGTAVSLTPRVFETLRYLVEHSGKVLDKEQLMEAVWPDSIVEENNLTQNISTLRRVFGDSPSSQRYIVTVPSRGYRFVPEVRQTVGSNGDAESEIGAVPSIAGSEALENNGSADQPAGRRSLPPILMASLAIIVLSLAAFLFWGRSTQTPIAGAASASPAALSIPEKSIAVLPFANLSDDKENAYFAAGIQDDLLTSLAQIHELKVISRTSVMSYQQPDGRNMREIGQTLGVANVLEGSVRRTGNRVLVNVQLIDARNDLHIWSKRYDRTLADSIGLQGELAAQIATALRAQLAPQEKVSLETRPTDNPEAYALYLQARERTRAVNASKKDKVAAVLLYGQAITLDPKFAPAYARRSMIKSGLGYYAGEETLKAEARADADEALRLSPSLAEAHTALGICLYEGVQDFAAALTQFSIAAAISPNETGILSHLASVYRMQGRWAEALAATQRAVDLDPRNGNVLFRSADGLVYVRDWTGARASFNRALQLAPDSVQSKIGLAYLEVFQNNNPAAGRNILQSIPAGIDPDGGVTSARWDLAMLERNYAVAEKILADFKAINFPRDEDSPKTFYQGRTALARGNVESAQRYFIAATPALEGHVRDDPDDLDWRARLALLYAYRQRKEDAIREGRRAVEAEPESQNAYYGAFRVANLALVYALVGEQDKAITLIERLLSTPGVVQWPDYPNSITLADLRLRWEWDSLRGNPRFQKILAGPEPKTTLVQATPAAPEKSIASGKSIAVLPFENLSDDKQNAYFVAGVQDEILSNLAKIAELTVTSRTSANLYKSGNPRNLREIGEQLGVAHLLEGSVQRVGNRLRVNAQLIDARNDTHLWAQTYDRDLADVFAIQTEIATTIVQQLRARLAPEEKARLEAKPTNNTEAYLLYLQANELIRVARSKVEAVNADKIYAQAIALDPHFALARARASMLNSLMYHIGRIPERKERARALAEEVLRLAPDLGDAHLALGLCFYRIDRDYDAALREFAIAGAASPNDSEILDASGFIYRRQGRWRDALGIFERAQNLDPRRPHFDGVPDTLRGLRQWALAADSYNHSLQLEPNLPDGWIGLAYVQFAQSGAASVASETLARLPDAQKNKVDATAAKWDYAMMARDFALAERIAADAPKDEFVALGPVAFFRACIAFARGDSAQAHTLLEEVLPLYEVGARDHPDDPKFVASLAKVYALLGRKEEAIRTARRAVELCPEAKDAAGAPVYATNLAFVYAQCGEVDQAVTLLSHLLTTPAADRVTLAHLRLSWEWDPLRKDPRFQKILEGPEPKTIY